MNVEVLKNLKYNFAVNVLDGAFFGFAMGFASFVTIMPLFVSTLTDSALLIGLIPAIHNAGWQLPQLFIAGRVARLERVRPMVLKLTVLERIPFLGLALVALAAARIGASAALAVTYGLLIIQGLGAGLTANPWTTMIGKIIPSEQRGTFFGIQAAAANLLAAFSAVAAGTILQKFNSPQDYIYCFLLCSVGMVVSWYFLSLTRESANLVQSQPDVADGPAPSVFAAMQAIVRCDRNFRWFLLARMVSQFAIMGFGFYTVYAVRRHGASEIIVGGMTGMLLTTQIAGNALLGWLSSRWGRKTLMEIGLASAAASALIAWLAPSAGWFYLVFALAAIGNVAVWTVALTMSLEFGAETERPTYIGMANTFVAPANILAPFVGGWLADLAGYPAAFITSALGALGALIIFHLFVQEKPRAHLQAAAADTLHTPP